MKVLSIKEPWATLIASKQKIITNTRNELWKNNLQM